jgi:hypothetical protein
MWEIAARFFAHVLVAQLLSDHLHSLALKITSTTPPPGDRLSAAQNTQKHALGNA